MPVRLLQSGDLEQLAVLHSLMKGEPVSVPQVLAAVEAVRKANGDCFVATASPQEVLIGYGTYSAVPALPGWYSIVLYIHPEWRFKRHGQALLQSLVKEIKALPGAKTIVSLIDINNKDLAEFAVNKGFKAAKYDWNFLLDKLEPLSEPQPPPGITLQIYSENQVARFVELYRCSFTGTPYFQAYSHEEARQEQLIFPNFRLVFALDEKGADVGVIWLRFEEKTGVKTGLIEPLGVIPDWRNKGLGYFLMVYALKIACQEGATNSELWVQSWNLPALQLYKKIGYRQIGGKASFILELD